MATTLTFTSSLPDNSDHPRWAIRVSSDGFNFFIDRPNCGPLSHFVSNVAHLNYHHADTIHIEPEKNSDDVKSERIGEVAGREIEQIRHEVDLDEGKFFLKMIVIKRGAADDFCEIYHQEWADGIFYQEVLPARLVRVGSEMILVTADPASGNGNWYDEHYWTVDKDGPIDLQVSEKVRELQERLLPRGSGVMNGGGFDVRKLSYDSPVWGPEDGHCCPAGGSIHIQFTLKNHRLIVTSQKYEAT